MAVKIDKGVPLPDNTRWGHRWPFHEMEVGDSFAVPLDTPEAKRVRSAACHCGKRHNQRFTIRTLRSEGVVRVWRAA